MAFPTNPTNGQQATVNGIVYTYSTSLTAWTVTTNFTGNITVDQINGNSISIANNAGATSFSGGLISVSGNVTGANINGTTISGTTVSVTGNVTSGNATVSTSLAVGATSPSGTAGEIRATNAITAFYSDQRLKTEIGQVKQALDKIDQLTGVLYTQNKLAEQFGYTNYELQVGLYAQDVQSVQPEAVKIAPFDMDKDGNSISGEKYLTVQYEKLVPLLIEGIKELRLELKKIKGE